ncbi:MAG: TlpA disulfide reductase family protein [Verrucomicrobia bacterium]|nr:TlpA disulfide reductase family protein [Verrucomicrobiota bacterium]
MHKYLIVLLASLGLCAGENAGAAPSLAVGAPAPQLQVAKWIKGSPVAKLEASQLYVVEFWATWCPPCRKSIPHLTELAQKYAGQVQIIGVSAWERESDNEARLAKVSDFVKSMGDKMAYVVAADSAQGFMAKHWMEAAGQNGIPASFIIKDGKIAWIGHPMAGLDEQLAKLVGREKNH